MKKAKLFKNGQSQAVRLPREFQLEGSEVYVQKTDQGVLLIPLTSPWEAFKQSLEQFSDDFLLQRSQPTFDDRDDKFE